MPEEMSRILLNGGEVRQIKNEIGEGVGPYRVWKRGEGYPGLAMSRSIGDLNGKKIGVIPNPGIV
jgi:integrin-linked kinase-associated serine/threonine phosphatase 2C